MVIMVHILWIHAYKWYIGYIDLVHVIVLGFVWIKKSKVFLARYRMYVFPMAEEESIHWK